MHACRRGEERSGRTGNFFRNDGATASVRRDKTKHPAPDYAVPPLRVNDVTIMSPSRIITIVTDTDLYNAKRSGNPGSKPGPATRNHLLPRDSPNCTSFLVARHFLNLDAAGKGEEEKTESLSFIAKLI